MSFAYHFKIQHIPNILTIIRFICVPFICILMWLDTDITRVLSFILTLSAAITDFFDGYIARKLNAISKFGICMDPIIDKVLIITVMIMLIYVEKIHLLPALVIIFREILISGIREFVGNYNIKLPVSQLAKIKTFLQMVAVIVLMIASSNIVIFLGNFVLYIAMILTCITGYEYYKNIKHLFN